ncbi:MAG: amidohydrolase family protein [Solirubrobacterales bacterium]
MEGNGKIALEEHFVTPELEGVIGAVGWDPAEWAKVIERLEDTEGRRLEEMDRLGIDLAVLSLGSDGIQGVADPDEATAIARRANDALAEIVRARPDRYAGFAAVALQDPAVAAAEAVRACRELGFVGVLVNGFSDLPDGGSRYYDEPECEPFWAALEELGVPLYLHPRNPLPTQRRIYRGREELLGPTWAFAVETGTHALRLITGGVFDRHPGAQVILGHLGEQLPFAMARLTQRIAHNPRVSLGKDPRETFRDNFHITTSGNAHTPSLSGAMMELGAERVMFAADYPFEEMGDTTVWFDELAISEADRRKIGRTNAERLLGL